MKNINILLLLLIVPLFVNSQQHRPSLFFCEEWKDSKTEKPLNQQHVANSELGLKLYGPGKSKIKKSHHASPIDDPYYVWSGLCKGTWAVALYHKTKYADLSKNGKIRWRAKQSGFRRLHIILKLADGTWLISDKSDNASTDWKVSEFNIGDLRWRKLDIKTVTEQEWVEKPNLSKVDEIGFTDLMTGGDSKACSRIDWIEVYAFEVNR